MARQVAAGMSNIDALAVALEESMAAQVAYRGTMMDMNERILQIKDALNVGSAGSDARGPVADVEDSYGRVPDLRVCGLAASAPWVWFARWRSAARGRWGHFPDG